MSTLTVEPSTTGLQGRLRVPGDKSISHRALIMSALADGPSVLTGLSDGADVVATGTAIEHFGAQVERRTDGAVQVTGGHLGEPDRPIDVGNSGTGIRLMAGLAAGIDGFTVLFGDESIARRPMGRVADPLRAMGAQIDGRDGGRLPPLVIRGGGLHGLDYRPPIASAQVKGAILIAGLQADGPATVREPAPTRIHTEQMLAERGVQVDVEGSTVTVHPGPVAPLDAQIPGDPSQAAFWVVAACLVPGSDLTVEGVYLGPYRAGFVDVLARMGAHLEVISFDEARGVGDIRARYGPLRGTEIGGAEIPGLIDEIPILAVAAAHAEGTTVFKDAAELKVKETDRILTMVAALRSVGAEAEGYDDGLAVTGSGHPTVGGRIDSAGDHRVAMALAVAGLAARHPVVIDRWEAVATSYPRFEQDMRACQVSG
jgi:3-phosphoshikimate 1-carboxyvinyltransferase